MGQSCDLDIEKTPIHLKFSTFIGIAASLIAGAMSVAGIYFMVQANDSKLEKIEPIVNRVPVLESNIAIIKDDISDIKGDIKTLLQRK